MQQLTVAGQAKKAVRYAPRQPNLANQMQAPSGAVRIMVDRDPYLCASQLGHPT